MPYTSSFKQIDPEHRLRITIEQIGQNQHDWTSDVRVRGYLYNDSDYRNWNLDNVVDRSIFGEDTWNPQNFSFDLSGHESMVFIEHVFTVDHNDSGTKTVNFTVKYGDTQISAFDGPQQLGDSLVLDRLGKRPNAPGPVTFSNVASRSLTARWAACSDDNGSPVDNYQLRWFPEEASPGIEQDPDNWKLIAVWSTANNLSRNVTGLGPGAGYIFQVRCENKIGWSAWTPFRLATMIAGARIRRDGKWTATAAFVRKNGKWHEAVPYVRSGGNWHRVE